MRTIEYRKADHLFVLRYEQGGERMLLEHLRVMVNDETLQFDWNDAAAISHLIGRHLADELRAMLKK